MDHMFNALNLNDEKFAPSDDKAPLDMMSKFLLCISERNMKDAQLLVDEILSFEPDNKMMLDYRKYIREYISQGLDAEEQVEEESEEDEEEDSHGSDDEEDDEEDEGDSNEGKEGEVEEGKFSGPAHSVNARTKK